MVNHNIPSIFIFVLTENDVVVCFNLVVGLNLRMSLFFQVDCLESFRHQFAKKLSLKNINRPLNATMHIVIIVPSYLCIIISIYSSRFWHRTQEACLSIAPDFNPFQSGSCEIHENDFDIEDFMRRGVQCYSP